MTQQTPALYKKKEDPLLVENKEVVVSTKFPKIARLKAEYYEWVDNLQNCLQEIKTEGVKADLFTFLQKIGDTRISSNENHLVETDSISILKITDYDEWWTKQINDKTRNMIRRAGKKGVEIKVIEFDDDLIKGIKEIYDESPFRQGKPFTHFEKTIEVLKHDHITFLEQSQFVGAIYKDELIGFAKLVHGEGISHLMQIISMMKHRNKAPTNALIAKSVEICAELGIPLLHYGVWSKGGLGKFKKNHAFERYNLDRYFVPLTSKGKLILKLTLHHGIKQRLPEKMVEFLVKLRGKWYSNKV